MMPRTLRTFCAVATACAATGLLASPVSAAAPEAYNRGSAWLELPADPLDPTKCAERKIWLQAGTSRWRLYERHWADPTPDWTDTRSIRLGAGTYTWRDCLDSAPPPPVLYRGYDHVSTLNRGSGPAVLTGYTIASSGNGTYEYGSALLRTGR